MLFCKSCGHQVEGSDRFCVNCMSRLDVAGAVIDKTEYSAIAARKSEFDPDGVVTETELTGCEVMQHRLTEKAGSFAGETYYRAVRADGTDMEGSVIRHISFPSETDRDYALLLRRMDRAAVSASERGFAEAVTNERKRFQSGCAAAGIEPLSYGCEVQYSKLYDRYHIFVHMKNALPLPVFVQRKDFLLRDALQTMSAVCLQIMALARRGIPYGAFSDSMIFLDGRGKVYLDMCLPKLYGEFLPFSAQAQYYRSFVSPSGEEQELYSLGMVLYHLISGFRHPYINPFLQNIGAAEYQAAEQVRMQMGEPYVPELARNTLGNAVVSAVSRAERQLTLEEFSRIITNSLNYLSPAELNRPVGNREGI